MRLKTKPCKPSSRRSWCATSAESTVTFGKRGILTSLHHRVGFHENASTANSVDAFGKYGIWSVPTAESAVLSLALTPSRRLLLVKIISLLHSLPSRRFSWLNHNQIGFYFWNLNGFMTWFLALLTHMAWCYRWFDSIFESCTTKTHKNDSKIPWFT